MDFDRRTGRLLSNYESALQSVEIILFTRIGDRVMRREFGGGLLELLGRLLTERTVTAATVLIATAIDLWEPRFRIRRVVFSGSTDSVRLGQVGFTVEADFRPGGHLNDFTVARVVSFELALGPNARVTA